MRILLLLLFSFMLYSCSKEHDGCNDFNAANYEPKTNGGDSGGDRESCTYPVINVTKDSLIEFSGDGGKNFLAIDYITKDSVVKWKLIINYDFGLSSNILYGNVSIRGWDHVNGVYFIDENHYYKEGLNQEFAGTFAVDSGTVIPLRVSVNTFAGVGSFYFH